MSKFIIIFIIGLAITTIADDYRSFTDTQGRTITAKILKVDTRTKKVTLERENKKKATVPISLFSETDQEYIYNWAPSLKREESERPSSEPKKTPSTLSKKKSEKLV